MGSKSIANVWGEVLMSDFKADYYKYCAELNTGYTRTAVQKHNKAMRKLSRLFHEAELKEDRVFYLELLNSPDATVRLIAAAHCIGLGVYISEAETVLKKIARNGEQTKLAFDAQATLDVWKQQGYLTF